MGTLRLIILAPLFVAMTSGCTSVPSKSAPIRFEKTGATQEQLLRDRYECYQETKQRVSGAYVNQYSGVADSRVIPRCDAFKACLAARGYIRSDIGNLLVPASAVIECQ